MKTNPDNILLIYPTFYRVTGYPIGLASMGAVLKNGGFEVRVFDTCFYKEGNRDQETHRAQALSTKKITNEDQFWHDKTTDMKDDLIKLIKVFKPKVIGITVLENTFDMSMALTREVKKYFKDITIVAGGIFPTLSPEIFIHRDSIDHVCIGEGEHSFLDLCSRIKENKEITFIRGFWVKEDGKIHQNMPGVLPDINRLPLPDYSIFDPSLAYKPMQGKLRRMIFTEASRGCAFKCTYCENSKLKDFYSDAGSGKYFRRLDMEIFVDHICAQVKNERPDFVYITSEDFLQMNAQQMETFISGYREKVGIPFFLQTRLQALNERRILALKDAGLYWLSSGLEHGNEKFRKEKLDRSFSNDKIVEVIKLLKKHEIGVTLQNILGFPYEDRELVFDTINLNRQLYQIHDKLQFNINMFIPYRSCKLYDDCIELGLIPEGHYFFNNMGAHDGETPLGFPESYRKELTGLHKTFNLYVKLPEKFDPQIRIAERDDDEGRDMFEFLSRKLLDDPLALENSDQIAPALLDS